MKNNDDEVLALNLFVVIWVMFQAVGIIASFFIPMAGWQIWLPTIVVAGLFLLLFFVWLMCWLIMISEEKNKKDEE